MGDFKMVQVSAVGRKGHGLLSHVIAVPLFVCAITGMLWTIQERWMHIKPAKWLMAWHQGDIYYGWLMSNSTINKHQKFTISDGSGPLPLAPLSRSYRMEFMIFMAAIASLHYIMGLIMVASLTSKQVSKQKSLARFIHQLAAILLSLPLIVTILSGAIYRILRLQGSEKEDIRWLLDLHQGYFPQIMPYFPLVMCLTVVIFTGTGIFMNPTVRFLWKVLRGKRSMKKKKK